MARAASARSLATVMELRCRSESSFDVGWTSSIDNSTCFATSSRRVPSGAG